jgi:quercetin dioxygenase-like cupin family protein
VGPADPAVVAARVIGGGGAAIPDGFSPCLWAGDLPLGLEWGQVNLCVGPQSLQKKEIPCFFTLSQMKIRHAFCAAKLLSKLRIAEMNTGHFAEALMSILLIGATSQASPVESIPRAAKSFSELTGKVVLDNERVLVQAFTVGPGQSMGTHMHSQPQVLVFVHGGILRSESTGRSTLWKDGRAVWLPTSEQPEEARRNVGATPVDFIEVTLKQVARGLKAKASVYGYLAYPNVPGEDIFENSQVIVQRFALEPGQWEGVHAHNPNTLYIFIKGGQWISKTTNPPSEIHGDSPDGDVGWMQPYDITAGHQSGNVGTVKSDVVWIALKQ